MKKYTLLIISLLFSLSLYSQNFNINLRQNNLYNYPNLYQPKYTIIPFYFTPYIFNGSTNIEFISYYPLYDNDNIDNYHYHWYWYNYHNNRNYFSRTHYQKPNYWFYYNYHYNLPNRFRFIYRSNSNNINYTKRNYNRQSINQRNIDRNINRNSNRNVNRNIHTSPRRNTQPNITPNRSVSPHKSSPNRVSPNKNIPNRSVSPSPRR